MKYEKIKEYFEDKENGLKNLLKDTEEVRDAIEEYTNQLMSNTITTANEYKEALNVLDGYYGFLCTIAEVSEAYSDSEEANQILNAKKNAVDDGTGKLKTPTDEVAKSIAKVNSAEYQRIHRLYKSYIKILEKRMMTIQSQLNHLEFEIKSKNSRLNE